MEIELKGIHYSEQLSQETNAISANLYINGYKAGTDSNQGHDGPTNYLAFDEKGKQLIKAAESYCKDLPSEKFFMGGEEHRSSMDLELYIDTLLTNYLKKRNLQQFHSKLRNYTSKNIVIGIPNQSFRTLRLTFPIDLMLIHPKGEAILTSLIIEKILPNLQENEKILINNIPEQILKNAGLSVNQYIPPNTIRINKSKKADKNKGRKP